MSAPPSPASTPTADQPLPYARLAWVALVTLLVFTAGIFWAVLILRHQWHKEYPAPSQSTLLERRAEQVANQPEVGMVRQRLFPLDGRAKDKREQQRAQLNSYGWVDKNKGWVHIPIERAMELLSEGQRP